MKKILLTFLMAVQLLFAGAFHIVYGDNIVISRPVFGDLYVAGENITINAPVYGDLVVAGGTLTINDTVKQDVILAGGNVFFNSYVGDDIRCAGGKIRISHHVGGDVVVAGGTITITADAVIGGLLVSGGEVTVDGDVMGEIKGSVGKLFLNGDVAEGMDCRGGTVYLNGKVGGRTIVSAPEVVIGPKAAFYNDLRYWTETKHVNFDAVMKKGVAMYDPSLSIPGGKWYFLGATSLLVLLWYMGMALLMIIIMQYLFAGAMKKAAGTMFNHALKSVGYGLLFFIGVPILAIAAFLTVVGVPVGLLLIFAYIVLILLATVITSVVTANWFSDRYAKKWGFWKLVFSAFGIFLVLKLVFLMPIIGWLVLLLMVCAAFGALLLSISWRRKLSVSPRSDTL